MSFLRLFQLLHLLLRLQLVTLCRLVVHFLWLCSVVVGVVVGVVVSSVVVGVVVSSVVVGVISFNFLS